MVDKYSRREYISAPMWQFVPTGRWDKDYKFYDKKHSRELAAVLNNLKRYEHLLKVSKNSKCVQAGYLHPEPKGVLAIDQKGGGGNLKETRLYTWADDEKKVVYLIAIGDKDSQPADIEYCKDIVKGLRNSTEE